MNKDRFIRINGKDVPVSEDVYYAFKHPAWAERKRREVRAEKERSLQVFMDDGFDVPSGQTLIDELVSDKLLLDELYAALAELTDDERLLIDALYYEEKSERELSKEIGVPQKTINNRKIAILKKLRKLFLK